MMIGDEPGGYKRPPKAKQFQKGRSGNPKGRPPGSKRLPPYEAVLGQKVNIVLNGEEKVVTKEEAFLLKMTNDGLSGDITVMRLMAKATADAQSRRDEAIPHAPVALRVRAIRLGTLGPVLPTLRIATKMNPFGKNARYLGEPWIVTRALERLGVRQLTLGEQQTVVEATRTPQNVNWPDWWEVTA